MPGEQRRAMVPGRAEGAGLPSPDCVSPPQLCEDLFSRINDTTNDNMSYSVEVGPARRPVLGPGWAPGMESNAPVTHTSLCP